MTRDLEIHIDELVLHGFDPAQRDLIAEQVAAALGSELAAGDPAWAVDGRAIDRLDVGPVPVSRPITARDAGRIGGGVATAVKGAP